RMEQQVPEQVKSERSDVLEQLEKRMREEYISGFAGTEEAVLLEEETETDGIAYMVGHTTRYVKVFVPEKEEKLQPNETVSVRISEIRLADGIKAEPIG
ncbi:MAG: hypothetical protein IJ427_03440, partial [Lachnospiraceae bacterium]|nr:hypothetical protein [Lachnospiraceae bacterium]